jgi:hypothetical protein
MQKGTKEIFEAKRVILQNAESSKVAKPAMQVVRNSVSDSSKVVKVFSSIARAVELGTWAMLVYQGVNALGIMTAELQKISHTLVTQTIIMVQKEFPEYVHKMLKERLDQTLGDRASRHLLFLYHPDDDWYPGFYHLLRNEPLGERFCGYTNQLDRVFAYMMATREYVDRRARNPRHGHDQALSTKIHLLIPAYQLLVLPQPIEISETIGDFVIEGRIHHSTELVWLNLPDSQNHYLDQIGKWKAPDDDWFTWIGKKVGVLDAPPPDKPRVLGKGHLDTVSNDAIGESNPEDIHHRRRHSELRRRGQR